MKHCISRVLPSPFISTTTLLLRHTEHLSGLEVVYEIQRRPWTIYLSRNPSFWPRGWDSVSGHLWSPNFPAARSMGTTTGRAARTTSNRGTKLLPPDAAREGVGSLGRETSSAHYG